MFCTTLNWVLRSSSGPSSDTSVTIDLKSLSDKPGNRLLIWMAVLSLLIVWDWTLTVMVGLCNVKAIFRIVQWARGTS